MTVCTMHVDVLLLITSINTNNRVLGRRSDTIINKTIAGEIVVESFDFFIGRT